MAFNLFSKDKEEPKKATKKAPVKAVEKTEDESGEFLLGSSQGVHRVISHVYVSEKSSMLSGMNKYVFKVAKTANKPEIKKHVEALYKVKVKDVRVLNMPEKSRNLGKRPGVKAGYRKAIVTLQEGQSIDQVSA
jgi:large subunit ribosomal protein L23